MLDAIGVASIDELFADVPEGVRLDRPLDLPAGKPEQEVYAHLRELAAAQRLAEDEIIVPRRRACTTTTSPRWSTRSLSRSEFLTPYTPYQPEISQGGLQVMFEYQTAISELTGLPVSNARVYEGPSALAAAGYLAKLHNKRSALRRLARRAPALRARRSRPRRAGWGTTSRSPARRRRHRRDALPRRSTTTSPPSSCSSRTSSAPSRTSRRSPTPPRRPARCSSSPCDPMTLGVLRPPGEFGVDIAVGEGQPLGNRLDFGGPSFGFFAAQEAYLRRMPGRIAGETTDVDGRRGFVLTLQTREQHIRREKATSNICTAQALNALAGVDLPELARPPRARRARRAAAAAHRLRARGAGRARRRRAAARPARRARVRGHARRAASTRVIERCAAEGVNPGSRSARLRGRRTACWSRSPSSARAPTSTASRGARRRGAAERERVDGMSDASTTTACTPTPASRARRPARAVRDADAARARDDDLREVAPGPPRVRGARARRARRRSTSCCPSASAAPSRRSCPRSPSRRSSATTTGSPSATSTSTRASTRSARAR